jgi:sarcosine oxidase subunit alpha
MSVEAATIAGTSVWLLAASYSGERAFEVYAPTFAARAVWDDLAARVEGFGGAPYGLDAMDLLRIEKGHIVTGAEIDGRMSPYDLGLGRMIRKSGFIGWAALQRRDRLRLVGLERIDGVLPEGAMLLPRRDGPAEGHVSSAGRRVLGEGAIGLGFLAGGQDRLGETVIATSPTRGLEGAVKIVAPVFYDETGARYGD